MEVYQFKKGFQLYMKKQEKIYLFCLYITVAFVFLFLIFNTFLSYDLSSVFLMLVISSLLLLKLNESKSKSSFFIISLLMFISGSVGFIAELLSSIY